MSRLITVIEATRFFENIIDHIHYRGEEFDVKAGNQIVAHISPFKNRVTLKVSDLNDFFAKGPKLDPDDIDEFERDIQYIRSLAGKIQNK